MVIFLVTFLVIFQLGNILGQLSTDIEAEHSRPSSPLLCGCVEAIHVEAIHVEVIHADVIFVVTFQLGNILDQLPTDIAAEDSQPSSPLLCGCVVKLLWVVKVDVVKEVKQ